MGQMSMFDGSKPLSVDGKKIRLIELFAGIGAQAAALRERNRRKAEFKERKQRIRAEKQARRDMIKKESMP